MRFPSAERCLKKESVTPVNEKAFYFTHLNGEAPVYDAENPYVDIKSENGFSDHIKDSEAEKWIDSFGLMGILEIIYNIFMNLIGKYFIGFIK